jgi:23S rRNA (guanosine2251-2'-O)-methyltransferase
MDASTARAKIAFMFAIRSQKTEIMHRRKNMNALNRRSQEETLAAPVHDILLILDDVRSMHNVGSAFRTADAFGLSGLYLCGFTPSPPHRDIRKTALGAEESVAWQHFRTIDEALNIALEQGYNLIGIEQVEGSTLLHDFQWDRSMKLALVFGNEVAGVSDAALGLVSQCIEIPQWGAKHSLNISVSIGVVLWELVRSGG